MRNATAFALGLLLSNCSSPAVLPPPVLPSAPAKTVEPLNPIILSKADAAAVQAGVKRSLKDPGSAQFGQMLAGVDNDGDTTVCLLVNARNSYGGYTGMKPYMGMMTKETPRTFMVVGGIPDHLIQHRDAANYKVCQDRGLALTN